MRFSIPAVIVAVLVLGSIRIYATPFQIIGPSAVTVNTHLAMGTGVDVWLIMSDTALDLSGRPSSLFSALLLVNEPAASTNPQEYGWSVLYAEGGPYPTIGPHEVNEETTPHPVYAALVGPLEPVTSYSTTHVVSDAWFYWPTWDYLGSADVTYTFYLGQDVASFTTTFTFVSDSSSLWSPQITAAQRVSSVFDPGFQPQNPIPPPGITPEPSTLSLLGIGLAGLIGYGWRRRLFVGRGETVGSWPDLGSKSLLVNLPVNLFIGPVR